MNTSSRWTALLVGGALLLGTAPAGAQDWPQWRGPNRDNKVAGFTEPKNWPTELTKKWQVAVGIGEASPLLVGDRVYTFGRQGDEEVIHCLDAGSGKELWKNSYAAEAVTGPARGYPGPRSTPAVGEGKVCTLGVGGVVSCLEASSGKLLWRKDTKQKPQFYTSTSPIIADGKCIVFLDSLTAYDLDSGDVKWTWSGGRTPYGSPVLMSVADTRMVVTPAPGSLAGVALADGKLLWKTALGGFGYQATYSTPVIDGSTVLYSVTAGRKFKGGKGGSGMFALQIEKADDGFKTKELWKESYSAAGYHTPVLKDGLLFGVNSQYNFFCADARTGKVLWTDEKKRGQCGCILNAGSVLLALTSDRDLIALEPSRKAYTQLASYRASDSETWCVPIVAGNRIFVKDKGGSLTLLTIE
jgi:outer membrane protein assembly factor BamB